MRHDDAWDFYSRNPIFFFQILQKVTFTKSNFLQKVTFYNCVGTWNRLYVFEDRLIITTIEVLSKWKK